MTLKTTLDDEGEICGSRSAFYHDAKTAHELLRLCKLFVPKPAECEVGDDAPESVRERADVAKKFWEESK